uniref:Uncharacterized protein n=1 Tax=Anopheles atroparvus TaxID=41427 RepID=A0AAG5DXN3_ANOAO
MSTVWDGRESRLTVRTPHRIRGATAIAARYFEYFFLGYSTRAQYRFLRGAQTRSQNTGALHVSDGDFAAFLTADAGVSYRNSRREMLDF